ncbi:MAG: hypothetical protein IKE76_02485 [Clostridia bacterium]|nr:hypothetical protein [Clostridia bacterium]
MSRVLVTSGHLQDIADAIRDKNGGSTLYRPGDMAAAIAGLYSEPTGSVTITENGTVNVKDYAAAEVSVTPALQSKTATQNGTVTPDAGYYGLSSVSVEVPSGGGAEPSLPSAYQEVEYLVSDGAEWITSDLPMVKGDILSFKFEVLSRVAQTAIGNRSASAARWDAGWENGSFYANNACYNIASIPGSASNIWEALIAITTATSTGFNYGSYLYSSQYPSHGRLYTLRVFRAQRNSNGTVSMALTAKYVPCYRKSDGVIGFYDVVNEAFYTNSGSGQFGKGGDVT